METSVGCSPCLSISFWCKYFGRFSCAFRIGVITTVRKEPPGRRPPLPFFCGVFVEQALLCMMGKEGELRLLFLC